MNNLHEATITCAVAPFSTHAEEAKVRACAQSIRALIDKAAEGEAIDITITNTPDGFVCQAKAIIMTPASFVALLEATTNAGYTNGVKHGRAEERKRITDRITNVLTGAA